MREQPASMQAATPASPDATRSIARPVVPAHLLTFLALDFGSRRTGVAFGNRMLRSAQPLATIQAPDAGARMARVRERVTEWQPEGLVVGIPFHPDGAEHENTLRARKFARGLRAQFGLPVFEVDERYSTTAALADGASDPDAGAACVILEQFLRGLP